jgi:hypothetical protein
LPDDGFCAEITGQIILKADCENLNALITRAWIVPTIIPFGHFVGIVQALGGQPPGAGRQDGRPGGSARLAGSAAQENG